ncbi:MAG: glycosyltransferase involved in cell wall biosynthesis [Polyangiales bacterium]|jgi:glycosyltransferase involved in cell wall biosynthesis
MRSLHIACLPYPSPQGTQALIHRQLSALALAGDDVHLLTYSSGNRDKGSLYSHQGCGGANVSLRSGPSVAKALADLGMIRPLREAVRKFKPNVVVGHNVEGAAVAHLAQLDVPRLYMAHTRMDTELPTYFGARLRGAAGLLGRALDMMGARADHVAAVSPWLAELFDGTYVPPPWEIPASIEAAERDAARRELGLQGMVGVYAGNLDAYQDWRQILALRRRMTLVVATTSDASVLDGQVKHVLPLNDESDRRRIHALADVALVPRGAAGGLPIKLIDALSRGVPVVASQVALAGLAPDGVSVGETLAKASLDEERNGGDGRRWVAEHANDVRFVRAMHEAVGIAIDKKARSVEKWR